LEKLGAGGVGEVWKARDRRLHRTVALKFISGERSGSAARELLREARAASALNHPNIVTIFEVGESDGLTYLAMEFVEGETLRAQAARGTLPRDEVWKIAEQVASGLAAAHEQGIIHRDLKPENIMIRRDGLVKLLDFGLAKLLPWSAASLEATATAAASSGTQSGMLAGTFSYMSPEQARGQEITTASDVFALGIVLYELLSGEHPFRAATALDTLQAIVTRPPRHRPEVPELVFHALRKPVAERFATAKEMLVELRKPLAPAVPPLLRQPWWMKAAGGGVLALMLGGGVWNSVRPRDAALERVAVRSVAVMNFNAPAGDAAAGVVEALAEELARALSQAGLRVAARSTMLGLQSPGDPRAVGTQLAVDAVLAGGIRSQGERFRITLELVDPRTGFQIWSDTWNASAGELTGPNPRAPAEIAERLKNALPGER
jgi:TolB-like protein/tRNA A-37 threonylcarbamoyl transferase component Bud32